MKRTVVAALAVLPLLLSACAQALLPDDLASEVCQPVEKLEGDVDPRAELLPVLPGLPVAGAAKLPAFRSGDSGAESRFPHLDRPALVALQNAGGRRVQDLADEAERLIRKAGGEIGQPLLARVGTEPQLVGFEWTLDGAAGKTQALDCGDGLVVTSAEIRADREPPCDDRTLAEACKRILAEVRPAISRSELEWFAGPGVGSQPDTRDDEAPHFVRTGPTVELRLVHTYVDAFSGSDASAVKDAFAEAGWKVIKQTCDGVDCGDFYDIPYSARFERSGVVVQADLKAIGSSGRLTLTAGLI